ncbi:MAG: NfeD family protein [Theionarchaea archaeon]|nr:NfeD family protein [Theionarchaea archaeon]
MVSVPTDGSPTFFKGLITYSSMQWKRIGAIIAISTDEMVFTFFFFVVLPLFNIKLPLSVYGCIMAVLIGKDLIVVRLIWNVVVKPPETGMEALVGKIGVAITDIDADSSGTVQIANELWNAHSVHPIRKGERVRILSVDGLSLNVEPAVGVQ